MLETLKIQYLSQNITPIFKVLKVLLINYLIDVYQSKFKKLKS